jgi:hypothetical protein
VLPGQKKSKALPTAKFWAHSIGAGVSAKLLGEAKGIPVMEREELFLAGLLHDLGKVPFGDEYIEVLNIAKFEQLPLIQVELDAMGMATQSWQMTSPRDRSRRIFSFLIPTGITSWDIRFSRLSIFREQN